VRNITFIKGEYYTVNNSGVLESPIFIDEEDRVRFLFLLLHFQSPIVINNVDWYVVTFLKKGKFGINPKTVGRIVKHRQLELISFNITPCGFTIILHNTEDCIISVYMQRILTGYSKYFNSKYKRRGHVFQGPFQARKLKKGDDIKKEITKNHLVSEKEKYSSAKDYFMNDSRWGDLLKIYTIRK